MSLEEPFNGPYLLLCEGVGDQRFFRKLLAQHGLANSFDVYCVNKEGGGRGAFGTFLRNRRLDEEFVAHISAVLVISDNDDANSFGEVRYQLQSANYPVPERPGEVARTADYPAVVVYMLPSDAYGNLEHLCLQPAYTKWQHIKAPLDDFVAATDARDWSVGKQAKMRMQSLLAAINDSQPDCGFGGSWNQRAQYQIPLDDPGFGPLVQFIRDFPVLVGGA